MALQGHSPPFATAGSPPRLINGQPEHHFPPPMYHPHRPMLPPSPQQFPRYQQASLHSSHVTPLPGSLYDMKALPPHQPAPPPNPQKRPGSSMSISSMLEAGPDRTSTSHELPHLPNNPPSRPGPPGMSVSAIMSPPNQAGRAGMPEYSHNRSQTPDRLDSGFVGNRHRSASGTALPLDRVPYGAPDRYPKALTPQSASTSHFGPAPIREEQDAGTRRTSISSILHRPNSHPPASIPPPQTSRTFDPLPPGRNNWYADPPPPSTHEPPRSNFSGSYDTRPPGFREIPRTVPTAQASPSLPPPQSLSPEVRRSSLTGTSFRSGLVGILNGPTSQPADSSAVSSHSMMRQDSSQSQSDRSLHGDQNRFRHFSPFAASAGDQGRKGSDEAPHKTIIGLGLENRRGRYSPVPQAVQGAQAQTPVPDGGIKSEQGKVFSGIGGGIGSSTTPVPVSSSPFKRDDSLNMSRTSSNIGKRSRKQQDDDARVDAEHDGRKPSSGKANKRTKYQNSYKADLEEMALPAFQRRSTPLNSASGIRQTSNPANGTAAGSSTARYDATPIFRPKKTVKIATIAAQTLRKPRRHLGTFRYDADVLVPENYKNGDDEYELCIKPNLPASFSDDEDLNCTYTIHVSKNWLHDRERKLITSTRNLWGTGIYTDDTDPVAAAMHMGWIKPAFHNIDESLLQKIVHDQNPKVDMGKDLRSPSRPLEIPKGRDLKITCVVMPPLERYEETARFGVRSRAWPEGPENTPHDGVSFSILKVEVVDIGPLERKLGRTGKSKRAWQQAQMHQRERAVKLEKERVARMLNRAQERAQKQKENDEQKSKERNAKRPSPLSNEITMDPEATTRTEGPGTIDGDEWRRQLAIAAA